MSTSFDYEFIFPDGVFNQTVYDVCTIEDTVGGRNVVIQDTVTKIQNIFHTMNALKVRKFSTFANYENVTYKVTVDNSSWGQ